jgi:hypothetical protein
MDITLDVWETPEDIKSFNNENTIKLSFFHNTPEEEYYNMPLSRLRRILKIAAGNQLGLSGSRHQENAS